MVKSIIILLVVFISTYADSGKKETQVGSEAPAFSLPDINNEYIALRDLCGENLRKPWKNKTKHVVVLSFFATWCKPCIAEIPHLQNIQKKYKNEPVKFFLVNVGEEKDLIDKFLVSKEIKIPILMDKYKKISEKYDAMTLPRLFIIDKSGIIQQERKGFTDGKKFESELEILISQLLDG